MPDNKYTIYLCGNISNDPETYMWRTKVKNLLGTIGKFNIIDPCDNTFNQRLLKKYKEEGNSEEFIKDAIKISQGILLPKDYNLVIQSDIILANLAIITLDKLLVGSLFELAWAWQFGKLVIGVTGENYYCKHPFVVTTVSAWADSVEDACSLILEFF